MTLRPSASLYRALYLSGNSPTISTHSSFHHAASAPSARAAYISLLSFRLTLVSWILEPSTILYHSFLVASRRSIRNYNMTHDQSREWEHSLLDCSPCDSCCLSTFLPGIRTFPLSSDAGDFADMTLVNNSIWAHFRTPQGSGRRDQQCKRRLHAVLWHPTIYWMRLDVRITLPSPQLRFHVVRLPTHSG